MEVPLKAALRIYCMEYYRQARRQNGVAEYPATLCLTKNLAHTLLKSPSLTTLWAYPL